MQYFFFSSNCRRNWVKRLELRICQHSPNIICVIFLTKIETYKNLCEWKRIPWVGQFFATVRGKSAPFTYGEVIMVFGLTILPFWFCLGLSEGASILPPLKRCFTFAHLKFVEERMKNHYLSRSCCRSFRDTIPPIPNEGKRKESWSFVSFLNLCWRKVGNRPFFVHFFLGPFIWTTEIKLQSLQAIIFFAGPEAQV